MWVYIGTSELKNAYIGEVEREPTANTVMYYPFLNDELDHVGSSSLPVSWTQQTIGYYYAEFSPINLTNPPTDCRFISVWLKYDGRVKEQEGQDYYGASSPTTYIWDIKFNYFNSNSSSSERFQLRAGSSSWVFSNWPITLTTWVWHHMAMGYDGTKVWAFLDGVKKWEEAKGYYTPWNLWLSNNAKQTVSEFIGEKVVRSESEVVDYYNATKSKYWIS